MKDSNFFRSVAREDLLSFCSYTDRFFQIVNIHKLMADALMDVANGKTKRLILELPPRSGKSRITSEFVAWYLGKNPRNDVILTGHSSSLLEWFSRNIRDRIDSKEYQDIFKTKLAQGNTAVKSWRTEDGGEFSIFWVWWWITWKWWHCILWGEKVLTNHWMVDIIDVVNNIEYYKVASFNHNKNEIEYKKVTASRKLKANRIYETTTSWWDVIRTTWEHKLFIVWQWYKEVEKTQSWEEVMIYKDTMSMWCVLKGVWETSLWDKEENKNKKLHNNLFKKMFLKNTSSDVQKMLSKKSWEKMKNLWMMQGLIKKIERYKMSILWEWISSKKSFKYNVFNAMQKWLSLIKNAMNCKSELETLKMSKGLSEWILQSEKSYNKKGQDLCNMQNKEWFMCSSQRLQSEKQWLQQFDNSLSNLSQISPLQERITWITSLEWDFDVYDIQVEDNENFFCNNILVHNCLIIDDPYSWREDAESDTIKEKTWDWYKSTFLSRRQNEDSAIIIIMQRWAEDDLVGRLIDENPDWWRRITIPAINDKGESFWPEKFSIDYLNEMRDEIGEYFFMSQYQQDPVNEWSWAFNKDMFQYYEKGEIDDKLKRMHICSFIDPAISKKQEADDTAIVTVWTDMKTNLNYVLEVKSFKGEPDEIIAEVFDTTDRRKGEGLSYRIGIETVQYQKMLALELKKQMRLKDKHFLLEEVKPQGEKESRIRSVLQGRYSSWNILHCKNVSNMTQLETELLKFPNWRHDDKIDALASAISMGRINNSTRRTTIYTPDYI